MLSAIWAQEERSGEVMPSPAGQRQVRSHLGNPATPWTRRGWRLGSRSDQKGRADGAKPQPEHGSLALSRSALLPRQRQRCSTLTGKRDRCDWFYRSTSQPTPEGGRGRNPEVRTQAETVEDAWVPLPSTASFPTQLMPTCLGKGTTHRRLGPPTSVST